MRSDDATAPIDYAGHVEADTRRLAELAAGGDLTAPVPSCPDWSLADLVWHLTEVQLFWAHIVEGRLDDPDQVPERVRPDDGELVAGLRAAADRLVAALRAAAPADACWTWSDDDQTVGFVLRRQAHEALIHRVDAELTVGADPTADPGLAADGVDEILRVMLTGTPDWARFDPGEETVRIVAEDAGREWHLGLGRFVGTSPTSGKSYDFDSCEMLDAADRPTTTLAGTAFVLDRWLWGRADLAELRLAGEQSVAHRLRRIAADATQ